MVKFISCLTENAKQAKLKSVTMADIVDRKLHEWTRGKSAKDARITIYYKIRDMPYAVIPELSDSEQYVHILALKRGSCTPKHFLLCNMYQSIGLEVLYAIYPFRWDEFAFLYPPELRRLAKAMPIAYHLACKVDIDGKFILVDATLEPALQKIGLPVNREWDGIRDTLLAVNPCGEEELYHPSEARSMQPRITDEKSLAFINGLNAWLGKLRKENLNLNGILRPQI
jgi:hypothetical protein